MVQGKYQVDSNGLVKEKVITNATSMTEFQAEIEDTLAKIKPDLNVTEYGKVLTTDEVNANEGNFTNEKPLLRWSHGTFLYSFKRHDLLIPNNDNPCGVIFIAYIYPRRKTRKLSECNDRFNRRISTQF